jgi:hypothetical protein
MSEKSAWRPIRCWGSRFLRSDLEGKISGFFFDEKSDIDLGVSRFLFFTSIVIGGFFWLQFPEGVLVGKTASTWQPLGVFQFFENPLFVSSDQYFYLKSLWYLSAVCSALGLWTIVSHPLCFLISLYAFGMANNFGKVYHSPHLPLIALLGFCFASKPGRLSLDYVLSKNKSQFLSRSFEYRWPLSFILCMVSINYFAAGWSKLSRSGYQWFWSDNLEIILLSKQPIQEAAIFITQFPVLVKCLAFMTVFIELLAPTVLFFPRLRSAIFVFPIFHLSTLLLMGRYGNFNAYLPTFLVFVPWQSCYNKLARSSLIQALPINKKRS